MSGNVIFGRLSSESQAVPTIGFEIVKNLKDFPAPNYH